MCVWFYYVIIKGQKAAADEKKFTAFEPFYWIIGHQLGFGFKATSTRATDAQ